MMGDSIEFLGLNVQIWRTINPVSEVYVPTYKLYAHWADFECKLKRRVILEV